MIQATIALLVMASAQAGVVLEGEGPLDGGSLSITDRFALRYYRMDDTLPGFEDRRIHDYFEEVNRFNLQIAKTHLAVGLQIDQVALFANRYILDDVLYHSYDLMSPEVLSPWTDAYLNVEKLYVRHQGDTLEILAGDGYVSFGRGLALNMVRATDIDLDTSLRGVRAVVHTDDWNFIAATGLTNPQQVQQDNRNIGIHPDISHMVSGLRVERFGLGPVNLGAHAVAYRFSREAADARSPLDRYSEPLDAAVGGASAEVIGLWGMDIYAEGVAMDYLNSDLLGGEDPRLGKGVYGSISAYPGSFVVLVEGKRYKDLEHINLYPSADGYEVVTPPTLEYERVITEDSTACVNSNDVAGGRVRVDYSGLGGGLTPYVSFGAFRDWDLSSLHFNQAPESVFHPIAGVQWLGDTAQVILDTGLRNDIRDDDTGQDTLMHADLDLQFPVGPLGRLEISSAARRFLWGENPQQQQDYFEMENALALHRGERWSYVLFQDYSDNPLVRSTGNLAENLYGAAEVQYKPTSASTLKIFGGAYKAGIRCSGGQCRSLPGFKGLRFTAEGTF